MATDHSDVEAILDRFLTTDALDAGCDRTRELLDVYVEDTLAGRDPEVEFPGIGLHLRNCGPCLEDFDGLLAAVRELGP